MDSTEIIQYWESKYASEEVDGCNFNLEPFLHGFLSAFSPGHSYHYIANFKTFELKFVSESVRDFTGIHKDKVTFKEILATADPSQIQGIKLKEQLTYEFYFNYLPMQEVRNYKVVYLYKMRDPQGKLRVMLHQALPLSLDAHGNLEHALSVHTDITYLKVQPTNSISFFSLNGDRSFLNVNTESGVFNPDARTDSSEIIEVLTPREREIVTWLSKGLSSKEISVQLNLSVHTIQKHRKNILQKTGFSNTSELVSNCIMAGLFV